MGYKKDIDYINARFAHLSDESRLWIFQSERTLKEDAISAIESLLSTFIPNWTSHNRQLMAEGLVAYQHFIIIALDESQSSSASGCSIDAMTHQIQHLSQKLNVNLLDRSTFYFMKNEGIIGIQMGQLGEAVAGNEINLETPVFNSLISKKSELNSKWILPLGESWHKRFL